MSDSPLMRLSKARLIEALREETRQKVIAQQELAQLRVLEDLVRPAPLPPRHPDTGIGE